MEENMEKNPGQDMELPTAAKYLEDSPVRYSVSYEIDENAYLEFNRFIFEHTGMMQKNRTRMKYMGIAELLGAIGVLVAAFFVGETSALFFFMAAVLLLGGILTMCYYPLIFPKQFEKSIHESFEKSGYMGRQLVVDFHDEGLVERSESPAGALWEDVRGFYEMDDLALLLMDEQQAVVIPKSAFGESYAEFQSFCEQALENAHEKNVKHEKKDAEA